MAGLQQLPVHMDQLKPAAHRFPGMGAVVQIIDILSDQQDIAVPFGGEPGHGMVGRIGRHFGQLTAALIVKVLDQGGIGFIALRRRHVLDPMTAPQAIRGAKGWHAGLSRYARTSENDDIALHQ